MIQVILKPVKFTLILFVPINRLSPIVYDQLTGDKIFEGAQLYQEFIILEREGECRTVHMRRTNTLRKVYSVNY